MFIVYPSRYHRIIPLMYAGAQRYIETSADFHVVVHVHGCNCQSRLDPY